MRYKHNQEVAAAKSGMSSKTARKYLSTNKLPSELKKERDWKTRTNVFEKNWDRIEAMLNQVYSDFAIDAEKNNKSYIDYLSDLVSIEIEERRNKTIAKFLRQAKLPRDKLLQDFEVTRIPNLSPSLLQNLQQGDFIDRCDNILIFGNPGTGKSHLAIALAREWCMQARKCLYVSAASLVQQLLIAKNKLDLNNFIKRLDRYEVLVIDDISYIPYSKEEANLLFVLLAERYEQRSLVITSNLVFSKWNQIFQDEMTTTAAIDRLVHHATIIELNTESYRMKAAKVAKNHSHETTKKMEESNVK